MSKNWMEAEFPRFNPTEERVNKLKEVLSRITEESIVEYADYFGVEMSTEEIRQDLEDSVFRAVEYAGLVFPSQAREGVNSSPSSTLGILWRNFSTIMTFDSGGHYWCSEDEMDGQPFTMGYTGGMSWGDDPTDYFVDFQKAGHFPEVLKLAVSYAIEDKEVSILAHSERIIKARNLKEDVSDDA